MVGSLDDVLTALEKLSAEMAGAEALSPDALVQMIARRQALVERIPAFAPLDPSIRERLAAMVRICAIIAGRLDVVRASLRQDIATLQGVQRFAEGLSHTVPSGVTRLNTRG